MATESITYTNPGGEANVKAFASGSYVSDGTDLPIYCGFVPSRIEFINESSSAYFTYVWFKGMAAGSYYLITAATGVMTYSATGGPTPLGDTANDVWDGTGGDSDANGQGFQIPAALLTDADTGQWIAYR